jgi:hypothetical protein
LTRKLFIRHRFNLFTEHKEIEMLFSLSQHLEGCTPFERCGACEITDFLRTELAEGKFVELHELIMKLSDKEITTTALKKYPTNPIVEPDTPLLACPEFNKLPRRVRNEFHNENITILSELLNRTPSDILRLPSLGKGSLEHVRYWLRTLGYELRKK